MQSALRPYVTAGVALVGASAIAVSPVTAPPAAIEEVRDRAVQLSALDNPIEVFAQVLQQTIAGAQIVGQRIIDNPTPILQQLAHNQVGNIAGLPEALQAQIDAFPQLPELALRSLASELANIGTLSGLGPTFLANALGAITGGGPGTLQDQIQMAIDATESGDFAQAFSALALIPLAVLGGGLGLPNLIEVLPALSAALQQPFTDLGRVLPIAQGPLQNAGAVAAALPTAALAVGVGPLLGVAGVSTNLGITINGLIEAAQTNDPELAFNTIVEQSSLTVGALLNSVVGQGGVIDGIQGFREAIAQALGAPTVFTSLATLNALPSATSKSVTLTTALEKAPVSESDASSGEDAGSGAVNTATPTRGRTDPSSAATPTGTEDNTKGGNLFTPGSSSTKGGRHRADTGSFAQGLRDTIKGLTGLGRERKSDKETSGASASKGGESGSSSSGSGNSSSGGDSSSN